jgi:hypothetical protein
MRQACGYSHRAKFAMHKSEWDRLERPAPLKYFDVLGLDRRVLDFVLDIDLQEYKAVLELPRYPKFAVIPLTAAVYTDCRIPGKMEEKEPVEYVFDVAKEKKFQCCINYPQLMFRYVVWFFFQPIKFLSGFIERPCEKMPVYGKTLPPLQLPITCLFPNPQALSLLLSVLQTSPCL